MESEDRLTSIQSEAAAEIHGLLTNASISFSFTLLISTKISILDSGEGNLDCLVGNRVKRFSLPQIMLEL